MVSTVALKCELLTKCHVIKLRWIVGQDRLYEESAPSNKGLYDKMCHLLSYSTMLVSHQQKVSILSHVLSSRPGLRIKQHSMGYRYGTIYNTTVATYRCSILVVRVLDD